jgi:hypothetical protein
MKKIVIGSIIAATTAMVVNATTVQQGWNLLGAGSSDVNLSTTYGSNPDIKLVWGFENDTKTWIGYSSDAGINQLLINNNLGGFESVPAGMGYWVLSNSSTTTVIDNNVTDNNISDPSSSVVYSSETVDMSFTMMASKNIFEIDWRHLEYSKIDLSGFPTGTITDSYYENGSWSSDTPETFSISNLTSYNANLTFTDGSVAELNIIGAKKIQSIDGEDKSSLDMYDVSLEYNITTEATNIVWENTDWTPTTWDNVNQIEVVITDIDTLKNQYLTNSWYMHEGQKIYMFEMNTNTALTSGNIVEAEVTGTYDNCTWDDCNIYSATANVVGSWSLANSELVMELPLLTKKYRFDSAAGFQEQWIEHVGYGESLVWRVGGDETVLQTKLEALKTTQQ